MKTTIKAEITVTDAKGNVAHFNETNIKHIVLEHPGGMTNEFTQRGL